ncbi:UDP-N-acetylglucosamine 2-epimerase [Campylobacter hepaticus]|uniref:UDP-N-acetylglucosamine 2-epimerase (Hydrolyzing) n=1 Tax=Campylobacter hepaticus TaxID=1813019 RepID=A0A6A7JTM2_9BACT|nr:UDP-N-acetylglucosamine 2-epimerase [Campylobacter hepaticus]AXP08368.1 UDP-N-acetylglucosamine 2-epimerase (hydrolyzing) [Campylobacter hepaticus]MCZ0772192.1 UDP-N-acetylglucosamine 2-epimerase [Campylobacter hepaticus]MCZ0773661.1 UDP-N-acetylglucosamine 2-epimerase [Campylobacter hepaticus]MCZ0774911.1 UDP-N-acetylglucosamine 2-epimerase [Campylobacter hepaticus]MDX2322792.1 UDP-N-acetylglucosamine 2-epimerase [Campylobacter hepaticus]
MKKILFITGTRADYSKIRSLMQKVACSNEFELFIFATGMHLSKNFGYTVKEIYKNGFKNIYEFINYDKYYQTDKALAATIDGFSRYVNEINPDLIVVHGDRIEPLAAAIVGALNNILVAHIEGGEISGTIDNSLRHAISKLAHIHLVNDEFAKKRLLQLGEDEKSIFIIGSPDLELLNSNKISLDEAKKYYDIPFQDYALLMFHPVTTEITSIKAQTDNLVNALKLSNKNYIVIYPNNDLGFELILQSYEELKNDSRFKIFPSLRFEYFISFLKHADFIIGNSSCILKEALYLKTPGILVGTRQNGRLGTQNILKTNANTQEILNAINSIHKKQDLFDFKLEVLDSSKLFFKYLQSGVFFKLNKQKIFKDI